MDAPNPYLLLDVAATASEDEMKTAFRREARRWHPDHNSSPEAALRFQAVKAAYELLTDPARRAELDEIMERSPRPVLEPLMAAVYTRAGAARRQADAPSFDVRI